MPTIAVSKFRGLFPKRHVRRLPQGGAQIAENVRFDAGDMSPIRDATLEQLLDGDIGNLYHYRHHEESSAELIAFGNNMEVYFARSPVPDDDHRRFYWNIRQDGASTDSVGLYGISDPHGSHTSVGSGANFRQFAGWHAGIPAPQEAPTISDQTDVGKVDFGEVTSMSNTTPITINTSTTPPFKDGDRVKIVIHPALITGPEQPDDGEPPGDGEPGSGDLDGQVHQLHGETGVVTSAGASSFDIQGISGSSFEPFTDNDLLSVSIERELSDQDFEARSYVFTYVSEYDEEGPPSDPSNILDVPREYASVKVHMTDVSHSFINHGGSRVNVNRIRIYRTASGETGARFLYVGEVQFGSAGGANGDVSWDAFSATNPEGSWNVDAYDEVPHISLGEPLPSERWYPPPKSMQGIHMMPSGFMVGTYGMRNAQGEEFDVEIPAFSLDTPGVAVQLH